MNVIIIISSKGSYDISQNYKKDLEPEVGFST